MKIHYALFDKSADESKGYPSWHSPEITEPMMSGFYSNYLVTHLHEKPNSLSADALWGGIVHIAGKTVDESGWLVLYREFDGGKRDTGGWGRPGGFTILTAWIKTDEVYENLLPIFNNKTFKDVQSDSLAPGTINVPVSLIETISPPLPKVALGLKENAAQFISPLSDGHLKIENVVKDFSASVSAACDAFIANRSKALTQQAAKLTTTNQELQKQLDSIKLQVVKLQEKIADFENPQSFVNPLKKVGLFGTVCVLGYGAITGLIAGLIASVIVLWCLSPSQNETFKNPAAPPTKTAKPTERNSNIPDDNTSEQLK
ncbi:MAG: hypothetical protein LBI18_14035 [Planctomycetaceae bacterium]|jgi:hypothetical protein|nr:hypothetical protein [Planctomycetaceae bacterium]